MDKVISKVSEDITIDIRSETRHYAVVGSVSTGLRYVVDLGVYINATDMAVLETLPAPVPDTDSLTLRIAGYHGTAGWQHFLQVTDLGSNVRTFLEPKEYYAISTFGEDNPVETFHLEPDLHVVWLEETEFYDPKISEKLGRCFSKGVVDMSVITHIASMQGSAWIEFVGNECEIRPDSSTDDFEESLERLYRSAGFKDEFEFVYNGEDDYYGYGGIEAKVKRGETVQLSGFNEKEIDVYRLHPDEETRNKAWREIMEVARHEAENLNISGLPSLLGEMVADATTPTV